MTGGLTNDSSVEHLASDGEIMAGQSRAFCALAPSDG